MQSFSYVDGLLKAVEGEWGFFPAHNKQQSPAQITAEAVATRGQEAVCNWQAALTERESCE